MTYNAIIALDWAIIALSLFNTIAFLWLGLTVLLNAERRHFGAWAAGGGLIVGGLFFAGHSAVVGRSSMRQPGAGSRHVSPTWKGHVSPLRPRNRSTSAEYTAPGTARTFGDVSG